MKRSFLQQLFKFSIAGVLLFCLSNKLSAQTASSYSFAASAGTYTSVSSSATASSLALAIDDAISTTFTFPSGFTFTFAGINYTQARVGSNGYLVFGGSGSSAAGNDLATTSTTLTPLLAPLWDDLACTEGVKYELTGTSPNRVLTIQWGNVKWNYGASGSVISFQIKLYETSNVIQYVYKQESTAYNAGSTGGASIGIKGASTTTDFISLASSGTLPTTSTATSTNNIAAKPADGQVYQFTPPAPTCTTPAPGSTVATPSTLNCLGNSTTLSLASIPSGTGNSFQWQSSPNNVLYTDISGAVSSSLTITPSAPTWYKCKVTCVNGPVTVASTAVQVIFSKSVSTTANGARCGTGTVVLGATGSPGTLNWYSSPLGGTAIGTGISFTTPTISATTPYYVGLESTATNDIAIGTATTLTSATGFPTAFMNRFTQYWCQQVFTASELTAAGLSAGNINSLKLNIAALGSAAGVTNFTVMMGNTSSSTLSTFTTTGLSTVYGPSSYTSAVGSNTVTFATPYSWDGTSNIILDIRQNGVDLSNNATTYYTATTGNTVVYAFTSSASPSIYVTTTTANTTTSRMNVIFNGQSTCSSPRVLVSATVNTAPAFSIASTKTICNNAIDSLAVTSAVANYSTYSWSPVAGLFTDPTCTVAYTAGASATKVYTKSATAGTTNYVATANNTTTFCAAIDSAKITVLPASFAAIATPSSICVSGNTKLTISPATGLGAASLAWQTSTDNASFADVSPAGTSTTYTTPSTTTSKYYRVTVKNSAGAACVNSSSDTALVYNPSVNTTTPATRCGPGTVTLGATAIDGNVNWYAASTGGSSLGSGTTFTTPSISSTTTYYAESRATPDGIYITGTGTVSLSSTGLSAFSQYYESARTQYLITASDMVATGTTAGQFATMAFNVATKSSTYPYKGYTIKLANTVATSLTGFVVPTFTTVYGPAAYSSVSGANVFTLSGGFAWDGTSNILVEICFSNATGTFDGWSSDDAVSGTTKSYTASYGTYDDNSYFCSGGTSSLASTTTLPNMTFTRLGCVSSRTAVVATVNTVPTPTILPATGPIQICEGYTTTLTGGGGVSYYWRDASGIISGATTNKYTTGTTGTYRVVVTSLEGCKDSSAFVAVNVNPTPVVSIAPVATTKICADSAQVFQGTSTGSGLTYKWFNSGTEITGATTDKYKTSAAGVYTLRVYLAGCSDTSNEATLIINPLPASSFTKTGLTGAICLDSTLELTALSIPATSTYQWMIDGKDIPGATSKKYFAPKGGLYTVRIKDLNNCRKISDSLLVINTPMKIPNLLPKEVRFCEGTDIVLYSNAGPYAATFKWTKDGAPLIDSAAKITTGLAGSYNVTATDIYGCVAKSADVTITVDALPVKPIINQTGYVLNTTLIYATYQWYRNGKSIAGANKRSYTMSFDGMYHVVVTNNVGCNNISDEVSVQKLTIGNVNPLSNIEIKVYPNPSYNIVSIEAPVEVNLSVKDMQGKQILELKNAKQVDMTPFADGMYIFRIMDNEGQLLKMDKVIKSTN